MIRTNKTKATGKLSQTQDGFVKRHPDGFGFFIPDNPEAPDVYIPRGSMNGVMTQDRVRVQVEKERGSDRYRGDIVEVLSRGQSRVMGKFQLLKSGAGVLRDDNKGWGADLHIPAHETGGAKDGDLVAAEILSYPSQGSFEGAVVKVLGDIANPLNDIHRVLFTQGVPHDWSSETLKEAEQFDEKVNPKDIVGRQDLRQMNFITIDGATAKDFDDAIYIESEKTGWRLWVAIADVSHYVKKNTSMDEEAYERGNSVYFPNFVVPMLPEKLSNGLCSLNPKVDRLVLVAEIQMDFTGEVIESRFYEGVINSKARVTYGQAQQIIEGEPIPELAHVQAEILRGADLAKILMAKRFREGSLDLEIPEMQILVDETGQPVDIAKHDRLFAHRLIEEMMLAANVAVARFLSDDSDDSEGSGGGFYRIHEPPNPKALSMLEKYLHNFGSQANLAGGGLQKRLTRALEDFSGKPEAQILNILTLRSMSQAKYSPQNLGHFGLGFDFYTHFTSPIRRYPDLIVHRLVKSKLEIRGYENMSEDDLATSGTMLSATEQRAAKSERQYQSIKKARYMEKYIGQEFEGMISSVTKFGVFVLLRPLEIDGLVPIEKLSHGTKDKVEFDEENLRLVQKRSGRAFELGDRIKIRVADADSTLGQVDFDLIEGGKVLEEGQRQALRESDRKAGKGSRDHRSSGKARSHGGSKQDRGEGHRQDRAHGGSRQDRNLRSSKGRNHRGSRSDSASKSVERNDLKSNFDERLKGSAGTQHEHGRSTKKFSKGGKKTFSSSHERSSAKSNEGDHRPHKGADRNNRNPDRNKEKNQQRSRSQSQEMKKTNNRGRSVKFEARDSVAKPFKRWEQDENPKDSAKESKGRSFERTSTGRASSEKASSKSDGPAFDIEEKLQKLRDAGNAGAFGGGVKGMIKVRQNLQFKSKSGSGGKKGYRK